MLRRSHEDHRDLRRTTVPPLSRPKVRQFMTHLPQAAHRSSFARSAGSLATAAHTRNCLVTTDIDPLTREGARHAQHVANRMALSARVTAISAHRIAIVTLTIITKSP